MGILFALAERQPIVITAEKNTKKSNGSKFRGFAGPYQKEKRPVIVKIPPAKSYYTKKRRTGGNPVYYMKNIPKKGIVTVLVDRQRIGLGKKICRLLFSGKCSLNSFFNDALDIICSDEFSTGRPDIPPLLLNL